jgi:hypothetical protein
MNDAVTADLRVHEARQSFVLGELERKANWISAERVQAELKCRPQDIADLLLADEDYFGDICVALALVAREPSRQIDCLHRILNAFSKSVGRRAENEWKEREAA